MHVQVEAVGGGDALPQAADVVIIGGGIVGISAAFALAKRGVSVALVEKGVIGGEQSSRNWGWCRQMNRDLRELELSQRSMAIWDSMAAETGEPLGFRRTGLVYATRNPQDVAAWEKWGESARPYQVDTRILTAQQVREMVPAMQGDVVGGVFSPTDGQAEPALAAPGIARGARRLGAHIIEKCAARGLEMTGGRVSGVVTERGTIKAQSVICAGGAWASLFMRYHGVEFPQASVRATAFRTTPARALVSGGFLGTGFALRARDDGSFTVGLSGRGRLEITPQGLRYAKLFWPTFQARRAGLTLGVGSSFFSGPEAFANWSLDKATPFEKHRTLDPGPQMSLVNEALGYINETFPALKGIGMARGWGGVIDSTPDAVPVISALDKLPGVFLAAGFSGHGFGIGPGAGQLVAEMAIGAPTIVDPAAFRLSRFFDGSAVNKPGMI
ncbi:FAD-binding oxidoreductase [Acetobacteraceae bacterium H6797]|nr:FAD-binding oxidoreductase [Acetobacteraceae bacterium H6797]